jgi:hypothetical protein
MSYAAAIAEWEKLRLARDAGADPAVAERNGRDPATKPSDYTVRKLCEDYLTGHVERQRKSKGAVIIRRLFASKIESIAAVPAETLSRKQAFDLLEGLASTPALAATLRSAPGAAWECALDAGRLPDT